MSDALGRAQADEHPADARRALRWQVGRDFHDAAGRGDLRRGRAHRGPRGDRDPGEKRAPRPGPHHRPHRDQPALGLPDHARCCSPSIFWITIAGANVPSGVIASLLVDTVHPLLREARRRRSGCPWWLRGLLVDGMYLATAWVVSVMLPPMAIFFPLFTLLEDFGYLPRVAFNLDRLFKRAGAHGKQALTMMMGFGCNAAGVVATRIIDSPRERLIAIITNNFALCNGRWPTQILIATIFIGALVPAAPGGPGLGRWRSWAWRCWASLSRFAGRLGAVAHGAARARSRPSASSCRRTGRRGSWQTLYTSLIDRTLYRAVARGGLRRCRRARSSG